MQRQETLLVREFSRRAALQGRWDIIHFCWPEWSIKRNRGSLVMLLDALCFFVTLRLAQLRGARVIWTLHNFLPHERDRLGIIDWFIHAFARRVDHTVCSSQTLYEEFVREYPALRRIDTRIHPISHYLGVYSDDGLSREQARKELKLPQDATVLLTLGVIRRHKNLVHLVRCFGEVATTRRDVFLLIAGPGLPLDDRFVAELMSEIAAQDRARLDLKYVEEQEIQMYLRAADWLVWPTLLPGNSNTVMVALSFGCPVLVPLKGPFAELHEDLGDWVHVYEGGLRASVLARVLETPRPTTPVAFDTRYSWDAAAAAYLAVYESLTSL